MLYISIDPGITKMGLTLLTELDGKITIEKIELIELVEPSERQKVVTKPKGQVGKQKTKEKPKVKKVKTGVNAMNQFQLCPLLIQSMNKWLIDHEDILESHEKVTIVLENQPRLRKLMDSVENYLTFFWVNYGITSGKTIVVSSFKPYNKLKFYTGPKITCTLKGNYAKNKYESIEVMSWLIHNGQSINVVFASDEVWKHYSKLKSKADVSDSTNMGITYIKGMIKK